MDKDARDVIGAFFLVIISVLICGAGYWYFHVDTYSVDVTVVSENSRTWIVDQTYEVYRSVRVNNGYSRSYVPDDAYNIECYNRVNKVGKITITDQDCIYTVNRWTWADTLKTAGARGEEVVIPSRTYKVCETVEVNKGCERALNPVYHWVVHFITEDARFGCDVSKPAWDDIYLPNTQWTIERKNLGGWVCNSLKEKK